MAIYEASAWLISQGLVMRDPEQPGEFYVLTRRGSELKSSVDVEAFRKGGVLPIQLLPSALAEKVHHLFVRGDHDVAVFQSFKSVEVAVRKACGYDNNVHGKRVFTQAFNVNDGPLRNAEATQDEREADALFVGAHGHCRNPVSHRDVDLGREEAARLIVFASHLLAIVEERAAALATRTQCGWTLVGQNQADHGGEPKHERNQHGPCQDAKGNAGEKLDRFSFFSVGFGRWIRRLAMASNVGSVR